MTPQELKSSILQNAVQGKLVEQRPDEGTGEELFQQIQAKKQALIKAGKLKKEDALPEINDDEIPFDIPDTWRWVRLGDCSTYTQRKEKVSPSDITDDMWSLDLEDIEKGTGRIVQYCKASERKIAGDKVKFYTGQVLYSKLRPYLKKVLVAPADGICTGEIVPFSVHGNVEPQYIVYVLTCPHVDYVINSVTYGVKMPRVGTQTMAELLIPLPPLAEQKRIVAKLEEILPLIDRYEAAWNKLEEFNKRFPGDMQKSILQLAIQGKLVEQRPEEGTGEELFQQIQAEKQALIKAGKIKKEKPLPEIAEDEIPFDIPDSWRWVTFGEISNILGTGLVRSSNEQYIHAQYYYFKMNNIGNFDGQCHFENMNMIHASEEEFQRYKIEQSDFLFNTRNSRELVGKTAVVPAINLPIILNNNILKIRFFGGILPEYINCFFNSPLGRMQITKFITNTTNVAAIYQRQLITLLIPLPPLAEQKRIVAKLEEILPLCDRLK